MTEQTYFQEQEKEFLLRLMDYAAGRNNWGTPHPAGTPVETYIDDMYMIKELNPFREYLMNSLEPGEEINREYEPSSYFDKLLENDLGKNILALWNAGECDAAVKEYRKNIDPFVLPKELNDQQEILVGREYIGDEFAAKVMSKKELLDDLNHDIELFDFAEVVGDADEFDWEQLKTGAHSLEDAWEVKEHLINHIQTEQILVTDGVSDPYAHPVINPLSQEVIDYLVENNFYDDDEPALVDWLKELRKQVVVKDLKHSVGMETEFNHSSWKNIELN